MLVVKTAAESSQSIELPGVRGPARKPNVASAINRHEFISIVRILIAVRTMCEINAITGIHGRPRCRLQILRGLRGVRGLEDPGLPALPSPEPGW